MLCFVYIVVFGGILQYQWFSLGSSKDITGNHFDGYEYIRGRQEYARKYGPKLTDETLAEMAIDYQRAANSDNDEEKSYLIGVSYHHGCNFFILNSKGRIRIS